MLENRFFRGRLTPKWGDGRSAPPGGEPGAAYLSKFSHENGNRTPITAFVKSGEEASLVYSTLTIHRERKRVILFLKPERNNLKRLVYRSQSLVDFKNNDQ